MSTALADVVGRVVVANNDRIRRVDPETANPRPLDGVSWHRHLVEAFPAIRAEWDAFVAGGGRLPRIEDVIDEHQGNEGDWRAGLLVAERGPLEPLASVFPATVAALAAVPDLRSALWSVMDAGTELPEHQGPNAGVLRYHLGVDCPEGAGLRVGDVVVPYRDGEGVLFDDTVPHAAWNRADRPRVTLFCEMYRPLPEPARVLNRLTQRLLSTDPRYRTAPRRAAAWHRALNPR